MISLVLGQRGNFLHSTRPYLICSWNILKPKFCCRSMWELRRSRAKQKNTWRGCRWFFFSPRIFLYPFSVSFWNTSSSLSADFRNDKKAWQLLNSEKSATLFWQPPGLAIFSFVDTERRNLKNGNSKNFWIDINGHKRVTADLFDKPHISGVKKSQGFRSAGSLFVNSNTKKETILTVPDHEARVVEND